MKGKIIKFKKNNKGRKKIILSIIILGIICTACTTFVFAKYSTEVLINASAKIAKPIIKMQGEETREITILSPKTSYSFSVKNYNEQEEINEVAMRYYIEIISEKFEFLEVHLYKGEEEIKLTDYKTEQMDLKINEKQEDNYYLEVKMLENIEETLLENIQASLEIKIHSIQVNE